MRYRRAIAILLMAVIAGIIWCNGGSDKWQIYASIATVGAVILAFFQRGIARFLYSPHMKIEVSADLLSDLNNTVFVRGKVTNDGDVPGENCRIKITRVWDGNRERLEIQNGYLQWQGGVRDFVKVNQTESSIFDIGTRDSPAEAPLTLMAYLGPNSLTEDLAVGGTYTVDLVLYGDNFRPARKSFKLFVGEHPGQIKIT